MVLRFQCVASFFFGVVVDVGSTDCGGGVAAAFYVELRAHKTSRVPSFPRTSPSFAGLRNQWYEEWPENTLYLRNVEYVATMFSIVSCPSKWDLLHAAISTEVEMTSPLIYDGTLYTVSLILLFPWYSDWSRKNFADTCLPVDLIAKSTEGSRTSKVAKLHRQLYRPGIPAILRSSPKVSFLSSKICEDER